MCNLLVVLNVLRTVVVLHYGEVPTEVLVFFTTFPLDNTVLIWQWKPPCTK